MTIAQDATRWEAVKTNWLSLVEALANDLVTWSTALGWRVTLTRKVINDAEAGEMEVPFLLIETPDGELHLKPIALNQGVGRIDLEARPTLKRVRLLARPGGWQIMTDSHIPLRVPWSQDSFAELGRDLLAWTH